MITKQFKKKNGKEWIDVLMPPNTKIIRWIIFVRGGVNLVKYYKKEAKHEL